MESSYTPRDIQRGHGSKERPLTRDLWARDSRAPTVAMRETGNFDPTNVNVDFTRYYDPEFARKEMEELWLKSWLFACREEDLPNVGDRLPFQVGPRSFMIVRSGPDEFKAFFNSCTHRGTRLCDALSTGERIVCPFHAWQWNLDGSLKYIPSHWDFRGVTPAVAKLRQVKLGRWGGFVFINADPNAPPFEDALSVLPSHFADYAMGDRYTAARFRKEVGANWKVVQEAFLESYHVVGTHPEAVPYNGDSQSQYDIWESEAGHIGRQVTPSAIPSMHAEPDASPLEAAAVYAQIMVAWHYPEAKLPELDPSQDLRQQLAEWHRGVQANAYGSRPDQPDAVMIDSTLYFMFPHFTVWLSESVPFVYQFTPHENDPERSYFEVRMMRPVGKDRARPAAAPAILIGSDESIREKAPAFGFLAHVFDQDMENMPRVQAGMRAADPQRNYSHLSTYQESLVQHWNKLIDKQVGYQTGNVA